MLCPHCKDANQEGSKVIDTTHDARGGIRRRRECKNCGKRYSTYERPILAAPLIIKSDGGREEFDREKLMRSVQLACVKLPVAAAEIDRLVGEIETKLMQMEKSEVSSRVVGDMVLAGLKDLSEIAYIRFALVYLGLNDLQAIRKEVDSLIAAS
ncbi:MAG: transcriptional regulator NrdR [Anaerolineales bacterium]|nr:transcriptional regulator NrdR [Anaerolineales bacterium]MCL4257985.1 transcriptional regulator NrdR [Anaerolineales bacterium]QYK50085.1 MAG: transcriptional regulator NrdR [Anaerolineales bacterium]UYN91509.1 MAG: transcriptional regulator NrdR [Anaerolineales bacterium]